MLCMAGWGQHACTSELLTGIQHPALRSSKPWHNALHHCNHHAAHATLRMMPAPCKTPEKTPECSAMSQRISASCTMFCHAQARQQAAHSGKPQTPVGEGAGEGRWQGWALTQLFWHGCATEHRAQGGRCRAGRERASFGSDNLCMHTNGLHVHPIPRWVMHAP